MDTIKLHKREIETSSGRKFGIQKTLVRFSVLAAISVIIEFFIEVLSRFSFVDACSFLWNSPAMFLFNALIIFATLCISVFFRRSLFVAIITGFIWVALGVVNCVILTSRTLPFAASDILLVPETIVIMPLYFSVWQIMGIVLLAVAVVVGSIFMFKRLPKSEPDYLSAALGIGVSAVIIAVTLFTGLRDVNISPNLVEGYDKYGFPYSFSMSLFNKGIRRPEDYSEEGIAAFAERIDIENDDAATPCAVDSPNIIMLQLESFFDAKNIKGAEYSTDPVPVFSKLREEYESGMLTVPTADGGTISTEFEVLTGMSLDYFAPGEYPYNTYLRSDTCESIAYNLRERGYRASVIHNFERDFYARETVFGNLGFEEFTALEQMENVEYNELGWARDIALLDEIKRVLSESDGRDFVYGISVQEHGKYPTEPIEYERHVTVSGIEDPEQLASVEYYVNQLYETDMFLGELVEYLESYDEPVMLVMFGDHMPDLSLTAEDLTKGNEFTTEYVIWTNYAEPEQGRDLNSYQLSAVVLEHAGFANGVMTKVHQRLSDDEDYSEVMRLIEYDLMCGDRYIYGGEEKYIPVDLALD